MNKKVYIVGRCPLTEAMFKSKGFEFCYSMCNADLVVFLGGADVSPRLYNQPAHPTTKFNHRRDDEDLSAFRDARIANKPMVGICRGGQFLHVMNGGKLHQDVGGHANGNKHPLYDHVFGRILDVTSTHHQQMVSGKGRIVASSSVSTYKQVFKDAEGDFFHEKNYVLFRDPEVIFHKDTMSLCYQPHPEFTKAGEPNTDLFFDYINHFLLGDNLCAG